MRGKQVKKHVIHPDEVYNSVLVSKLINRVMLDGKKSIARGIVYKALEDLGKKTGVDPIRALEKAIDNVRPKLEVRSRRVGGANYQVPVPVAGDRQLALTLRWIIGVMRNSRGSKETWEVLSRELFSAYNGEGEAIRKKEDVQRMAESNRAFAQFAF
jgi:small subunit ribosomal protein S7